MVFYFYIMAKENKIFGIYPVLEALKAAVVIDKLYVQKDIQNPKIQSIIKDAEKVGATINSVPVEKLNRLTNGNHQGVVAVTSPIDFPSLEETVETILKTKEAPLFIILDQISDVRNFGAILRTAECTGVDAVIIQKKGGAPVSGDTVKTSAGAIFNIPICKVDHIGKGVSKSVLSLVDEAASLPLIGTINSLNVSVACGAFLYEILRQRSL